MIKVLIALKKNANQNNRKGVSTDGRSGADHVELVQINTEIVKKKTDRLSRIVLKCFFGMGKVFHKVVAISGLDITRHFLFYCNSLQ